MQCVTCFTSHTDSAKVEQSERVGNNRGTQCVRSHDRFSIKRGRKNTNLPNEANICAQKFHKRHLHRDLLDSLWIFVSLQQL